MSEEKQELTGDEEAKKTSQENNTETESSESQYTSPEETQPADDPTAETTAVATTTEEAADPTEDKTATEAESETSENAEGTSESPVEEEVTAEAVEAPAAQGTKAAEAGTDEVTEPAAPDADTDVAEDPSAIDNVPVSEEVKAEEAETPAADETHKAEPDKEGVSDEITEPVALDETEPDSVNSPEAAEDVPASEEEDTTSVNPENPTEPEAEGIDTNSSGDSAEEVKSQEESAPVAAELVAEAETTEAAKAEESEAPKAEGTESVNDEATDSESKTAETATAEEEGVEEAEEELIDYSEHTREQLADVVDELSKQDNFKRSDAILSKVLPLFKAMARARRQEALDKFLADGGERDDFEYRHDEVFNRFDASVRLIRDRRASYYKEREARKEANYQKKLEILDKLRELIDGEKATTNLAPIKALQEEWKALGAVPAQHNRTLWANYNALLDRFYNNRHILFELKELDRKKNLVKKTELCEKAEALDKLENIKDAIVQLNELHEEYKKIGAVPREVQEELWQRFKAASDAIYKKRKSYLEELKGELHQNLEKKKELAEQLRPFTHFDSDRINDWNAKTKEILAIQKKWDAMGGLPREHAKEVNKAFWSAFKSFFSNKNAFFKKLEGMRHENLQKKEELVAKAEALKDNTDWDRTSEALKGLQRQWKEIGPVPEKFRNSVYAKFKEACDAFFNNRRASQNKAEAQYVENQKHKEDLIKEINERTEAGGAEASELDDIMVRWSAIGFVPRGAIKSVEEKFAKAIEGFVNSLDVPEEEREALVLKAELSSLKKGPNSDRRLNKKEAMLRKQIQELEDNINLWNNNLAFFANSKTADKLKEEFDEKIAKAEEEIAHLKKQLKLVRSM